jgi:hypothetical protein
VTQASPVRGSLLWVRVLQALLVLGALLVAWQPDVVATAARAALARVR